MQIFVIGVGKTLAIDIESTTTVDELTMLIQDRTGLRPQMQSLYKGIKSIYPMNITCNPTLHSFGIASGDTISIKIRVQPKPEPKVIKGPIIVGCQSKNLNPIFHKYDSEFWIAKVYKNPMHLAQVPPFFRNDKTVVQVAVLKNWNSLQFASINLLSDPIFLVELAKQYNHQNNLPLECCGVNFLDYVSKPESKPTLQSMQHDSNFVMQLIEQNQIQAYTSATRSVQKDILGHVCSFIIQKMDQRNERKTPSPRLQLQLFHTPEEFNCVVKIAFCSHRFELLDLVSTRCLQEITKQLSTNMSKENRISLHYSMISSVSVWFNASTYCMNRVEWCTAMLLSLLVASENHTIYQALSRIGRKAILSIKSQDLLRFHLCHRQQNVRTFIVGYAEYDPLKYESEAKTRAETNVDTQMTVSQLSFSIGLAPTILRADSFVMLKYVCLFFVASFFCCEACNM